MPSLDQLRSMLTAEPNDPFLRYALAMEHMKQNQLPEALAEFADLLTRDPNYIPAYFMYARAQTQAANIPAARDLYTQGIALAQKLNDPHAAAEMSQALAELPE